MRRSTVRFCETAPSSPAGATARPTRSTSCPVFENDCRRILMAQHRLPAVSTFVLVASLATAASLAQYAGPSTAPQFRAIADILKNPVDDAQVVLEGYVSKQVSKEKYLFTDGQSEIRVEIDSKDF